MIKNEYLINPPSKYRPMPFWSWNEKLDIDTTLKQIDEMKEAGMGGFFMHARGGLQTEYLGEEWFENIKKSVEHAQKNDMLAWGYDENGWPSGFASGKVCEQGTAFQQKRLRCDITDKPVNTDTTISNVMIDGINYHSYYVVNPYYVDVLNPEAVKCFINNTHEKYKTELGDSFKKLCGFFTDEPQILASGIGWSFVIPKAYKTAYGVDIEHLIPCLFFEIGNYKQVRYQFWHILRELFCENFLEQISKWCHKNDMGFTGHMMLENRMVEQIGANSAIMSIYEYLTIPGMDYLGKTLAPPLIPLQVASVAHQLGKKQTISETFAMCGWNVSFEELRWNYEWLMVHGITLLCQHLEGYSIRGIRKRDYPASLFVQQPWWNEYRYFNDLVSRIGMLLTDGETNFEVLLLHPQETAWINYNDKDNGKLDYYDTSLCNIIENLEQNHICFDLGDEKIMERHARIENGKLVIGKQSYSTVIVPPSQVYSKNTLALLKKFKSNGSNLLFCGEVPTLVCGNPTDEFLKLSADCKVNIEDMVNKIPETLDKLNVRYYGEGMLTATKRSFNGMTMYYFVNSSETPINAEISAVGKGIKLFESESGGIKNLPCKKNGDTVSTDICVLSNNSVVLFFTNETEKTASELNNDKKYLQLGDEWHIEKTTPNAMILDYCDCYFDGELYDIKVPVNDIQELACERLKPVDIKLIFHFNIESLNFHSMRLMIETPEIFDIAVNGNPVKKQIIGTLYDDCFKLIDIRSFVKIGENTITLKTHFAQTEEFYKCFKNCLEFESEKNKLTYGQEIEAIYLVGDFAVKAENPFSSMPGGAFGTDGLFIVGDRVDTVRTGNLITQGFPFFSGRMTLSQNVNVSADKISELYLKLKEKHSNIVNVYVNGQLVKNIMWQPYEAKISNFLHEGNNLIEIELVGSLRNILGPFHLKSGEPLGVAPCHFFHNSKIWANGVNKDWTDTYSLVPFGLYI